MDKIRESIKELQSNSQNSSFISDRIWGIDKRIEGLCNLISEQTIQIEQLSNELAGLKQLIQESDTRLIQLFSNLIKTIKANPS